MFKKPFLLPVLLSVLLSVPAFPARADAGPITLGLGTLTSMALSPDGTRLAVGTTIGVYFYDAQTFAPTGFWRTDYSVSKILWSPRNNLIALFGYVGLQVRSGEDGAVVWTCSNCGDHDHTSFDADGTQLIVVTSETTARTHDAFSGALLEEVKTDGFWFLADWQSARVDKVGYGQTVWSANGLLGLVSETWDDSSVSIFDIAHRELTGKIYFRDEEKITTIAFSPNGNWLATGSESGAVRVWALGNWKQPVLTLRGHYAFAHALAWSSDGKTLYSAGSNTLRAWDVASGAPLRLLDGFTTNMNHVMWAIDNQRVIAAQGNHFGAWDVTTRLPVQAAFLTSEQRGSYGWSYITDMIASPTGEWIAVADHSGATLHQAVTLQSLHRLKTGYTIATMAFSPNGKYLATGGASPFVLIWEVETARAQLALIADHQNPGILALAFSTDGDTLYAFESRGTLRRWNLSDRSSTAIQTTSQCASDHYFYWYPCRYDYRATINPTAQRLAIQSPNELIVSDLATGNQLYNWRTDRYYYSLISVVISPQGTRIAAVLGQNIHIWNVETGELMVNYSAGRDWHVGITDLAFSPDGARLAASNRDGTVKIWPVP